MTAAIFGAIAGIAVLAVLYAFSMLGYFVLRRRRASAKYFVEIVTVLFAVVLSVAVKLVILFMTTEPDFGEGFASALIAVYSGIGGLTFEGISSVSELGGFLNCLYAGTSLYAGLIALSVITARASYEIYSYIALRFLTLRMRGRTDVYVFMTVTDDALLLANNIRQQPCYARGERRCVVLFTGDEIGVFDRKNPLHREIMSRGYLYWEYAKEKNGSAEKSVLKRLHLYVNNGKSVLQEENGGRRSAAKDVRIYMFALGLSGELKGSESSNGELIYGEIRAMVREMAAGEAPECVVDFYLLTESEINYSFYSGTVRRMIEEVVGREDGKKQEELRQCFQLHVISEPKLSARCLIKNRAELFRRCNARAAEKAEKQGAAEAGRAQAEREDLFLRDNEPGENNIYRAIVLGFGKTGQMAMNAVFTDTAYTDKNGEPSQFAADVYDLRMDEIAGLFSVDHPLYLCATRMDEIEPFTESGFMEGSEQCRRKIARQYEPLLRARGKGEDFADIVRGMKFPWVTFHKASCFQTRFVRFLDAESGIGGGRAERNKLLCNAFIIALGDDEANIRMANSLIDDLKHEAGFTDGRSPAYPQMIYVNLRDERNRNRVNWSAEDEEKFESFKVVLFGNRVEMYSYEQIIDDVADMEYDYAYNTLYGDVSAEAHAAFVDIKKCLEAGSEEVDFGQDIKNAVAALDKIKKSPESLRRNWLGVPLFDKESNYAARRFREFMAHAVRRKALTGRRLIELARLEHVRWCRFHMAYGWTYRFYGRAEKTKFRPIKEHNNLCPFGMLPADTQLNNLVNVALAAEQTAD